MYSLIFIFLSYAYNKSMKLIDKFAFPWTHFLLWGHRTFWIIIIIIIVISFRINFIQIQVANLQVIRYRSSHMSNVCSDYWNSQIIRKNNPLFKKYNLIFPA
jgi:hypothetical protein